MQYLLRQQGITEGLMNWRNVVFVVHSRGL